MASTATPRPWDAPAIREMCSSISVPLKSFTPTSSRARTPSTPFFTQEPWTFGIRGWRAIRPTAWIFNTSRHVGPVRDPPRMKIGERWWTKGSGTSSVNPPVSAWRSRRLSRCCAQTSGSSMCPNMTVVVDRSPLRCAIRMRSSQSVADSFSGVSFGRTRASRISAAVPGIESTPASASLGT